MREGEELPEVTRYGLLCMQVCVPKTWTDDQVNTFAEQEYPCGTSCGWSIRRQGDPSLNGDAERVACHDRADFVHVMLDA